MKHNRLVTYIAENGMPFALVFDSKYADIFGNKKSDKVIKGKKAKDSKESEEEYQKNVLSKFQQYLAYAKVINEMLDPNDPIHLDGRYIVINNKRVGYIETDLNDMDSGINFVDIENKFSKEFDTIEELYSFLVDRYNVKGA